MDGIPTVKFITLGDSSVGKTSILLRFTDNTFNAAMMSTVGIDSKSRQLVMDSQPVNVQIWDTAGQQKYRTISHTFYKRADGVMLVYDVNDKNSLGQVSSWMAQIKEKVSPGVPIALIGNKIDLAASQDFSDGESLAQSYGIKFFPTSAKTGANIDEAFTSLVAQVLKNNPALAQTASAPLRLSSTLPPPKRPDGGCCSR